MDTEEQAAKDDQTVDQRPPLTIDVRRLHPMEIVIARRYVHEMPAEGFDAFDDLADQLDQQLEDLPTTDLPFAREVYGTFATSPYPIDRINVGLMLRPLTLVDHATGLRLWNQLVRDEHPAVRRDIYGQISIHLDGTEGDPEVGLAKQGLTLADGQQLRVAFIAAGNGEGLHIIGETNNTEALREATRSFETIARV